MPADKKQGKPKEEKVILHRNAKDGQFVTEAFAKRNPATTEREVRPVKRTTRSKGK
jgi:hypothetical protein